MSESFWINEELDENQLVFGSYKIVPENDWELLILNLGDRVVGSIEVEDFTTIPYHTSPYEMDGIEPDDISYISVKEINIDYNDADVKQFLRDYFTKVRELGGTAIWHHDQDPEEVECKPYDYRDTVSVFDLNSLVDVYNRLADLSSDNWDKSVKYDAESEEEETPDEFGLTSIKTYYRYFLPPEIALEPIDWAGLVEEAVGKYEYINPLVEVPLFIMTDKYQQFNDVENGVTTKSYDEWVDEDGVDYMLSVVDEIEDYDSEWAEELRSSIISRARQLGL